MFVELGLGLNRLPSLSIVDVVIVAILYIQFRVSPFQPSFNLQLTTHGAV